jgi:hypothetical protein
MSLVLNFLEHEFAAIPTVEVPHGWILLLDLLEVMQNRFAIAGKLHFCVKVQVYIKVIAKRSVAIHAGKSS